MAEQFSLPQDRVLEDLDGEGYNRSAPRSPDQSCPGGPLTPSSWTLVKAW